MLFGELKRAFPQVHVARRLSRKAPSSVDVDIVHKDASNILLTESEEKDRQMEDHTQDVNIPLTRFEQSFGGHVPVGDDGMMAMTMTMYVHLLGVFFLFLLIA